MVRGVGVPFGFVLLNFHLGGLLRQFRHWRLLHFRILAVGDIDRREEWRFAGEGDPAMLQLRLLLLQVSLVLLCFLKVLGYAAFQSQLLLGVSILHFGLLLLGVDPMQNSQALHILIPGECKVAFLDVLLGLLNGGQPLFLAILHPANIIANLHVRP